MMGCIQIYYGDGKGKTTAAMGLALRALGNGMEVVIAQFLKSKPSGEIRMLQKMTGVQIYLGKADGGFTATMTQVQLEETLSIHLRNFEAACRAAQDAQVLILDEILGAIEHGLFPQEQLAAYLDNRPETVEIILTGHVLPEALAQRADYLTEMCNVRHPYERGILARKGVEF